MSNSRRVALLEQAVEGWAPLAYRELRGPRETSQGYGKSEVGDINGREHTIDSWCDDDRCNTSGPPTVLRNL